MKRWIAYISEGMYGSCVGVAMVMAFDMWGFILAVILSAMHIMSAHITSEIDISEALEEKP